MRGAIGIIRLIIIISLIGIIMRRTEGTEEQGVSDSE